MSPLVDVTPLVIVALSVLPLGCAPPLDQFIIVPSDASPSDASLSDATRPDGMTFSGTGGPCGEPMLLVAVESVDGDAPSYGRVARFDFLPDGTAHRCGDVTGAGALLLQPVVVASMGDDVILVADVEGRYQVVNGMSDRLLAAGSSPYSWPADAFPLLDPRNNETGVAVGWRGRTAGPLIRWVTLYDRAGEVRHEMMTSSGEPGLGSLTSMTMSPVDRTRILGLDPNSFAAVEASLFTGEVDRMVPYTEVAEGTLLTTIAANSMDGQERVIWTGRDRSGAGVFYQNNRSSRFPAGPYSCGTRACSFEHAVPDPTDASKWIALCGAPGTVFRDVVRFSQFGESCEVILAGSEFESRTRLSYLSTYHCCRD